MPDVAELGKSVRATFPETLNKLLEDVEREIFRSNREREANENL